MKRALLAGVVVLVLTGSASAQGYQSHPPAGKNDPYGGYTTKNGKTSCCNARDCHPVPYDLHTGLIQWGEQMLDPHALPSVQLWFSFDDQAHACGGDEKRPPRCIFIPGQAT